ncbi:MAG TPA: TlyA family RNA methyltransferase [Thermodesulfobacteriota bacterium]|nr:TlyA family RNA methyltransferase [Thermodesulfobacteriota bacterium]
MKKERLDNLLVERGLVPSRERAKALITAGKVLVNGQKIDKPGADVNADTQVQLISGLPYVSRGGLKLEGALKAFGIDPKGIVVMDVGASTGGFTDCALQRGAKKVYAVDVGYGQLAWELRKDPRVVNLERTNIRYLRRGAIEEKDGVDLILIDTSFISIEKFLLQLLGFLKSRGSLVALIKPQFEVGKGEVGKGGVVKDPALHQRVIERISTFSLGLGLSIRGVVESPLRGPKGNKEFFIHLQKMGIERSAWR